MKNRQGKAVLFILSGLGALCLILLAVLLLQSSDESEPTLEASITVDQETEISTVRPAETSEITTPVVEQEPMEEFEDAVDLSSIEISDIEAVMEVLDAGALHPTPFSDELPVLEVTLLDTQQTFGITIDDGNILVAEEAPQNPDVTFSLYADELAQIEPSELLEGLAEMYENKRMGVKYHKSQATLGMKGYGSLANKFS